MTKTLSSLLFFFFLFMVQIYAGVFYCGAPALTKELRQLALDFSHRTSTKFEFHKENF
jgi:hypothetical protein